MKKSTSSLLIFFVIIPYIITSCNKKSVSFSDEDVMSVHTDTMVGSIIKEDLDIRYPRELFIADSIFLVQSVESSSNIYMWILDKNGKIIGNLIEKGNGPNEIPNLASSVDFNNNNDEVTVWSNPYLVDYKVTDFIQNRENFCKKIQVNPEFQDFSIDKISKLKNGMIGFSLSGQLRFKYSSDSGDIITYEVFPSINSDLDNNPNKKANVLNYGCSRAIKPDNTMFVTGTYIGAILELFSFNGQQFNPVSTVYIYPPVYKENELNGDMVSWDVNTIIGFDCIRTSDNYIYTLLNGVKGENLITGQGDKLMSTAVTIFNWEGKPVRRIETGMQMLTFDIDENNNIGYAITINPDNHAFNLVSFPLSNESHL